MKAVKLKLFVKNEWPAMVAIAILAALLTISALVVMHHKDRVYPTFDIPK